MQFSPEELCRRSGAAWAWPGAQVKPSGFVSKSAREGQSSSSLCLPARDNGDSRDCCGKQAFFSTAFVIWDLFLCMCTKNLVVLFFLQLVIWKTDLTMEGAHLMKRWSRKLNKENNKCCWDYVASIRAVDAVKNPADQFSKMKFIGGC